MKVLPIKIKSITVLDNPDPQQRTWDLQVAEDHTYLIGTSLCKHVVSHNTECRLTKFAEQMFFSELNEDVIPWHPNYAENRQEPSVLPAELPNLLLNGSQGIAVGLATDILPFNARELIDCLVDELDNETLTKNNVLHKAFNGPDFPTAGVLENNKKSLELVWNDGKGSFKVRGSAAFETDEATSKKRVIITSIPWQINKSELVMSISALAADKDEEGHRVLEGITRINDESSDEVGIRIVLELSNRTDPNVVLNLLYQKTRLQESFSCNIIAIDGDKPVRIGVRTALLSWLKFRRDVVRKQLTREQRILRDRLELVNTYIHVHNNVDRIIKTIRESENAIEELKQKEKLNDKQAEAIVRLALGRLRKLDHKELINEKDNLEKRDKEITVLLNDKKKTDELIKQRLLWWKNEVDDRRTKIVDEFNEISVLDTVVKEDLVFSVNEKNEVKATRLGEYRQTRRGTSGVNEGNNDETNGAPRFLVKISTHDRLFVFTDKGRCHESDGYSLPVMKRTGKPVALKEVFPEAEDDEHIVEVLSLNFDRLSEDATIVMVCSDGFMKRLKATSLIRKRGNVCSCFNMNEGTKLVGVSLALPDDDVNVYMKKGDVRRFPVSNLRVTLNRSCGGVKTHSPEEGDAVLAVETIKQDDVVITVSSKGFGARIPMSQVHAKKGRCTGGVKLVRCDETTGDLVFAGRVTSSDQLFITTSGHKSVRIPVDDVREVVSRGAKGVRLQRMNENEVVVAAARLSIVE